MPGMVSEVSATFVASTTRRSGDRWEVFTYGGRKGTGMDVAEWAARGVVLGAGEILLARHHQQMREGPRDREALYQFL